MGFFSSPGCCDRVCSKLSKEDCLKQTKKDEIPYYCNIGGKCIKSTGTVLSRYISANNCGTDILNNQILLELEEIELSKSNYNLLQNIISDINPDFIIKIINNKKILLYYKNIEIIELKILKNSINLIFLNDNLEIKNISRDNWIKIYKMIKLEYLS